MGKRPVKKRFEVTITREIQHRAVLEVEAVDEQEARKLAEERADEEKPSPWREELVIDQQFKVAILP